MHGPNTVKWRRILRVDLTWRGMPLRSLDFASTLYTDDSYYLRSKTGLSLCHVLEKSIFTFLLMARLFHHIWTLLLFCRVSLNFLPVPMDFILNN